MAVRKIKPEELQSAPPVSVRKITPEEIAPTGPPQVPMIDPRTGQELPQPVKRPPPPDKTTLESLAEGAKPAMIGTGGVLGGALGAVGGPPGAAVGAGLGAAAGSLLFDTIEEALQAANPERTPFPGYEPTLAGRIQGAGTEAALEVGTASLGPLLFPVKRFLTPALGKVFGVRGEPAKLARNLALSQGIELGAVDIGNAGAKGFAKVVGIFPFTGTPFRVARDVKEAQLASRINNMLDDLAPTATLSGEVGVDLMKAAQGADEAFKRQAAVLYDKFRAAAEGAGAVIPTGDLRAQALKFAEDYRLGQITLDTPEPQVLTGGLPEGFDKFIEDMTSLPQNLTFAQFQRLKQQLKGFANQMGGADGFTIKRVAQLKQAMESDLNGIADPTVRDLKNQADQFFSNGILVFQTPTAGKFGRVDRNLFKAGPEKLGSINPDELLKPLFNADSSIALRDLRSLVGDDAFRRATRAHFDDVLARSYKTEVRAGKNVEVFDPDAFAANLGLVRGFKDRTAAVEEMLRGTGVKMEDEVSLTGAKSEAITGQAFRRPIQAGGELVNDISYPIVVGGRHWGCLRIGYIPEPSS